ncbi:DUF2484 family protein [Paracoccus sp. M683]|uniref:DUF2484 family protein n=1 Tax=Paracoccus sp. M683 TaxID=2594268 RepID=UPI00117E360A|nr:DUF2484 family protein [Paracoccus sp. M683]TRW97236.1 DUF2484 family protein [Paracoccus sp. M683]
MTAAAYPPLAAALIWLVLALLVPLLAAHRHLVATWALVVLGVPVLGWLTLRGGPAAGIIGLALGVLVLYWRPFTRRRDATPAE